MAKRLKNKGTVLKEVLVINEHYGLHLTMKQSMIDASRQKKSAFTLSEVKTNTVYPGNFHRIFLFFSFYKIFMIFFIY